MNRRQRAPVEKIQIILEEPKESMKLSELCNRYQIKYPQRNSINGTVAPQ